MDDGREEEFMCGRKIQYRSKKRALKHLNKIRKIGLIVSRDAHAYLCPYCFCFHLGGNDKHRYKA